MPTTTRPMEVVAPFSTSATAIAPTPTPSTPNWSQGIPGPRGPFEAPLSRKGAAALNRAACRANSQKTSRQSPNCSTSPPNSGPIRVATPQMKVTLANTRARCRSGNINAMATMAKPEIHPDPSPWISRPARKIPTSGANALITQPAAMIIPASAVAARRPNISDKRPELAPARIAPTRNPAVAQLK